MTFFIISSILYRWHTNATYMLVESYQFEVDILKVKALLLLGYILGIKKLLIAEITEYNVGKAVPNLAQFCMSQDMARSRHSRIGCPK